MTHKETKNSLFTLLVFVALVLTFAAVVLSAYLRLKSIGLGCEDWPACFGHIAAEHKPSAVPTTTAGAIHRFTATVLGLVVLGITLMALRGRRPRSVSLAIPLLVFGLTVFLSVLGYNTPSPLVPAVALGNLGGGMAMLALLWWMGQRSVENVIDTDGGRRLRYWALPGLLVVALQITLGAWTSANFAGPSCTILPGCQGEWFPVENLTQGFDPTRQLVTDDQSRVITGDVQATLHMAHRLGAAMTLIYLLALAYAALRLDKRLRNTSIAIIALAVLQAGLGITAVIAELPLLMVTAHNAIAAVLLLAMVNLIHLLVPTE